MFREIIQIFCEGEGGRKKIIELDIKPIRIISSSLLVAEKIQRVGIKDHCPDGTDWFYQGNFYC
jgi:hypothetical protein